MKKKRVVYEAQEDYLESIYYLSLRQESVRSVDVAEERNVSKATVSQAVHALKTKGLLDFAPDGALLLTETGEEIAKKVYERHELLTRLLIDLGVSVKVARHDACRLEHFMSEETFQAFKKLAETMKKDT